MSCVFLNDQPEPASPKNYWSTSINGDASDCKSGAFGHAWFDSKVLHHYNEASREMELAFQHLDVGIALLVRIQNASPSFRL